MPRVRFAAAVLCLLTSCAGLPATSDARWIWTTEQPPAATATRYFRTEFELKGDVASAKLVVTCDNQYVVFVNGQQAGDGRDWQEPGFFSVGPRLVKGKNCVAVAATNAGGPAGLLLELVATLKSGETLHIATNKEWLFSQQDSPGWQNLNFDAKAWEKSADLGGWNVGPWSFNDWPGVVANGLNLASKFKLPEGFVLEEFATDDQTGSAISITFNAKGQLLCSAGSGKVQEIRVLEDKDGDGVCDGYSVYQEKVYCQGLVAVGPDVYAVANTHLYYLPDANGDNKADKMEQVFSKPLGGMGEHGPHAVVHGPDGQLYIILGNAANFDLSLITEVSSPVRAERLYWGNLLPPQSSQGFMDGIGPPGGIVLRTNFTGKKCEVIANGFRNAYDLAFSPEGDIFTFDSDMEWDIGLPWYRPVRICHVTQGAEFGWRFGGGKWKDYYPDNLPGIDVGRGSPTGVEIYDHTAFPPEYRGAQFHCDWALGKIVCLMPQRAGGTWAGKPFDFLSIAGRASLPVTDCVVGPDGALYVSYGGRDTRGGVYRVRYTGGNGIKNLFNAADLNGIAAPVATALNQPQPLSAFSRKAITAEAQKAGGEWRTLLAAVAQEGKRPAAMRLRAIDLLGMDGTPLDTALLEALLKDAAPVVRAKAAWHCGLNSGPECTSLLIKQLGDNDGLVLRRVCEGLQRNPDKAAVPGLLALLSNGDRYVRYHARIALLRIPAADWSAEAVKAEKILPRAEGLLAWAQTFHSMNIDPQRIAPVLEEMLGIGADVLEKSRRIEEVLTAQRALGLILLARKDSAAVPAALNARLSTHLLTRLDGPDFSIAAEAAELLAALQHAPAVEVLLSKMANEGISRAARIQYAFTAANIHSGWSSPQFNRLLDFVLNPGPGENGHAFAGNMQQIITRVMRLMPAEQRSALMTGLPDAKLAFVLTAFSAIAPEEFPVIRQRFTATKDRKLQEQILTLIGGTKTKESFAFLESVLDETSADYDTMLAHLMRNNEPGAAKYALKALASLNQGISNEALYRSADLMAAVAEKPVDYFYGLVLCASRNTGAVREKALELLARTPFIEKPALPTGSTQQVLFWQDAFEKKFPQDKRHFPELTGDGYQNEEKFNKLAEFLRQAPPSKAGDAAAGKALFTAQKCVTCHAFRGEGQMLGPDLSEVGKRFEWNKILEDVVYPSRVVDARYRQMNFKLKDGQRLVGFVVEDTAESRTIADANGIKTLVKNADIEKITVGDTSIMPNNLLDTLKPEQIRDLLRFLGGN